MVKLLKTKMKTFEITINLVLIIALSTKLVSANIKCLKCTSSEDVQCVTGPKEATFLTKNSIVCDEGVTGCFSQTDETTGVTTRGCQPAPNACAAATCTLCAPATETDEACNTATVPENRRQCIQCSGKECYDNTIKTITICSKYDPSDKCAMKVNAVGDTLRGCVSDGTFADCPSKNCITCDNADGCNTDSSEVTVTCLTCTSAKTNSCKRLDPFVEKCTIDASAADVTAEECEHLPLGTDPENSCYTLQNGNLVQRGCAKDKPADAGSNVTLCSASNCNNGCVKDVACLQCTSANDTTCAAETPSTVWQKSCPAYTTGCSRCMTSNGTQVRGCEDTTDATCSHCYTEHCAADKPKQTCYTCKSNDDPNCAQWTDATKIPTAECTESEKCLTVINEDKHIERRCAKKDETCPAGKQCQLCDNLSCNGGLFPQSRRRCYQCSSADQTECSNVESNADKVPSKACVLYDVTDECYSYALNNDEVSMVRGCKSDASFGGCTDGKCLTCSVDNCNHFSYKRTPELKCIQCQDDDVKCAWGYAAPDAKDCINQVVYNANESCYTQILSDDKTKVKRGCLLDVSPTLECAATGNTACESCNDSDGCNNKTMAAYTCIRCRTDNPGEKNCSLMAEGIAGSSCTNPVPFDQQGCYTERWQSIVIRGCVVDLDSKTKANCKDENYKQCDVCTDAVDCNNKKAPNSAVGLSVYSGLLGMAIAVRMVLN